MGIGWARASLSKKGKGGLARAGPEPDGWQPRPALTRGLESLGGSVFIAGFFKTRKVLAAKDSCPRNGPGTPA